MPKHVLLIAPYIHDFAAYDLWLKPLGLLYVAAAAEAAGYSVRVANCLDRRHPAARSLRGRFRARDHGKGRGKFSSEAILKPPSLAMIPRTYRRYGIPLEAFRNELCEGPPPDVIGVGSMMTYWCGGVAETIAVVREMMPGVPVALGGVYATLCAGHAREHSGADSVVEGPGEDEFVALLRETIWESRDKGPSLNRPAYHLLEHPDSVSMVTSFGCPFACAYCASRFLRRSFSQRPVQDVVGEISCYVNEMHIRDITFYDDALLVNPELHIKPILREVIGRRLLARFHTPNGLHANMIDEDLAGLMRAAGFLTVRLSLESISPSRLRDSCAKVTRDGFEGAVSSLFAAGYAPGDVEAYVLMGAPGQRVEEVEETIFFAHKCGAVTRLADFSPIPGTTYFGAAESTYGLDLSNPLLQNSSVYPYLIPGLPQQYARLKSLVESLNSVLLGKLKNRLL